MQYISSKLATNSLYQTAFDDGWVVWTLLPWSEYKKYREARQMMGASVDIEIETDIYNRCVVYSSYDEDPPLDLSEAEQWDYIDACRDDQPAGVVSTVVKMILSFSGSMNAPRIMRQLDRYRGVINNVEDQLVVAICRAFPSYTPEMVENMEWQTLLKRAAQAEAVLGGQVIEPPFRIEDPKENEKQQARHYLDIQKEIRETTQGLTDQQDPKQEAREAAAARRERQHEVGQLREQYFRNRGI